MLLAAILVLGLGGMWLAMVHLAHLRDLAESDAEAGRRGLVHLAAWVGAAGVFMVLVGGGYCIWYGRRVTRVGAWPLHRPVWPRRVRLVTGARARRNGVFIIACGAVLWVLGLTGLGFWAWLWWHFG